jgi:hypothetical protein
MTLDGSIYARGFGDGLHEGIVSLMILKVNPHSPLHVLLAHVLQEPNHEWAIIVEF